MKKTVQDALLDAFAFITLTLLLSTGLLMALVLRPGTGAAVWGLSRHAWGDLHFWIAVAFVVTVTLHLLLHARWIKAIVAGRDRTQSRRRTAAVLVALVLFLALAAAPFLSPVDYSARGGGHRHGASSQTASVP